MNELSYLEKSKPDTIQYLYMDYSRSAAAKGTGSEQEQSGLTFFNVCISNLRGKCILCTVMSDLNEMK